MASLKDSVAIYKAIGEPTRLRLLALLATGELTVKDLTDILGQSQPRVSRHLKLLADAGLIERHAEGAWAYFRLAESGAAAEAARQAISGLAQTDTQVVGDRRVLEHLRAMQRQQAETFFAQIARNWDAIRQMHVAEEAVEAAILKAAEGLETDLLLDLGTGTGRMLELLADRYARGIGIDASHEMLGVARAKLHDAGISHAQVRLGDLNSADLSAEKADLITIHQVLHYFDDPSNVLTRAGEALSPHGRIIVIDLAPHALEELRTRYAHRRLGLSGEQMQAWAAQAGLCIESEVELAPDSKSDEDKLTVCLWVLAPADHDN